MGTKFLTGGSQDIITELWDLVVIFRNSGLPGTVKIKINDRILYFLFCKIISGFFLSKDNIKSY